jgi:hypothetical protein
MKVLTNPDTEDVEMGNFVDLLMDDSQNEAQLIGTGSDHGTCVLLKSHQGHTSQAYSLEKTIPSHRI